jgi:hypothetical protein
MAGVVAGSVSLVQAVRTPRPLLCKAVALGMGMALAGIMDDVPGARGFLALVSILLGPLL